MSLRAVVLWGSVVFGGFAALAWSSRASDEVPPVIGEVRRVVRDVRPILDGHAQSVPADALPGESGMCVAPLVPDAADDIPERETVEHVLARCSRAGRGSDPWMVLQLVRLERDLGAPAGMLTSVACWETGFRGQAARGDWERGVALAHGPLQLHEQFVSVCGLTRTGRDSVEGAARCYWSRVLVHAEEAKACTNPLQVGEAMTARGGGWSGCEAMSDHARELARWAL